MKKILILGAGAMGSAFVFPCIDNGHEVSLIGTHLEDKFIDNINKKNNLHPFLNCKLPAKAKILKFEKFNEEINKNVNLIVLAVNSKGIEWAAEIIGKAIKNYISERLSGTPLGRLCTTNDIAQITAFLVSSESDFINGKSITVDGGKTTD